MLIFGSALLLPQISYSIQIALIALNKSTQLLTRAHLHYPQLISTRLEIHRKITEFTLSSS